MEIDVETVSSDEDNTCVPGVVNNENYSLTGVSLPALNDLIERLKSISRGMEAMPLAMSHEIPNQLLESGFSNENIAQQSVEVDALNKEVNNFEQILESTCAKTDDELMEVIPEDVLQRVWAALDAEAELRKKIAENDLNKL